MEEYTENRNKNFELNEAPQLVLDTIYEVYKSRNYSCCFRFFTYCCLPDAEDFTVAALKEDGELILAQVIEDLEKIKVKPHPSERSFLARSSPQLIQGEIRKTAEIIQAVQHHTKYEGLDAAYVSAITKLQNQISANGHDQGQLYEESADSFEADF